LGSPNQNSKTVLNSIHKPYTIKISKFCTDLLGKSGTKHLIDNGCKRLGFMGKKDMDTGNVSLKFAGYFDALDEAGLPYYPELRIDCEESGLMVHKFRNIVSEAVASGFDADGLVCGGYGMGRSACQVFIENDLRVPEDIVIVADDDSVDAEFNVPSLTSLYIPRYEMGLAAAELLLELIEFPASGPLQRWVDASLIERNSSRENRSQADMTESSVALRH